jgi:hypothetical protein
MHTSSTQSRLRDADGNRNFVSFIHCLVRLISPHNASLSKEIDEYLDNLWNVAPELMGQPQHWTDIARILANETPERQEDMLDWHKQIIDIFNDKIKFEEHV